jgi:chaperonin GroES
MYQFLEQHLWLDLDGDGYAEPYVATVRLDTGEPLRLVARYFDEGDVIRKNDSIVRQLSKKIKSAQSLDEKAKLEEAIAKLTMAESNKVIRITPPEFFTKYTFIPAPDGGFYDLGFGALLGPLNETVNTLVNQMLDSGTMNTTAGGFLGRGVKMKGGQTSFDPFEWKPVDSTGDDLRKNIFPLPVREPSAVLFQLLSLLITYGEKVSGATDIMTGVAPGQNTPAETSRNTIEQGMKIFSGIFRRMHRGFTRELCIYYHLNRLYLKSTPQWEKLTDGPMALIAPTDYDPDNYRIAPSVMPTMVSEAQRQTNATMVYSLAQSSPGFNMYLVVKEVLEAYNTPNIDLMFPDPTGPNAIQQGPDPKMVLENQKLQLEAQQMQLEHQRAMAELQQQALLNQAKITELQAKATKLLADAEGIDTGHQIALLNAEIGAARNHEEGIFKALGIMQKAIDQRQKASKEGVPGGSEAKQTIDAARGMAGVAAASPNPTPTGSPAGIAGQDQGVVGA